MCELILPVVPGRDAPGVQPYAEVGVTQPAGEGLDDLSVSAVVGAEDVVATVAV
jgi:hypothetical protein